MKKVIWLPKDEMENENSELWQVYYNDPPSFYGGTLDDEEAERLEETHVRIEVEL